LSTKGRNPICLGYDVSESMAMQVTDNPDHHRFELALDGHTAFASYRRDGDLLLVYHTEVPREFEGRGIGSALVKGMLEIAREQGLKVKPSCSFVAAYMRRHPETTDLRA
jgi:predicted GNAT family acetyltransferase